MRKILAAIALGAALLAGPVGTAAADNPPRIDQGAASLSGRDAYDTPCDDAPDPNNCSDPYCVSAGNPNGVCWYDGHQFPNRTVCIEGSANPHWSQATAESALNYVQYQWNVNGLRIYVRSVAGGCLAAGFVARQIVYYLPYIVDDGNCGQSESMGVGYPANVIRVNMNPDPVYTSGCRSGGFWNRLWAHDFGHQIGLSHTAEAVSLMRMSLYRSSIDAWKVANLYTGNPCGDPLWPACV